MNLDELNESQRQAVVCCDAPSLVIAGAGSGKTRVLTYKIAYLLEHGISPGHILALTFTNKAAREMKERITRQVGPDKTTMLWMGTFHSIFSRILRMESERIGYRSDFTIYDAADSKSLIRSIIRERGLDDKKYKESSVASSISNAKNALILPADYRNHPDIIRNNDTQYMREIAAIYEQYAHRCKQSNAMDFDDLLLNTWLLFKHHPEVADQYQDRFQYVLVDEYQDTNYAQHQIVWLLTNRNQRVCVVGDDAQSIYSFRGAKIDNILNFKNTYRNVKEFKLEQNYRSTQTIVNAANSLIKHNERQLEKNVYSKNDVGSQIEVCQTYSDVDEANVVVRKIRNYVYREDIDYKQIAVLYRTNAQSRSLEEAMRKGNIPYRIYGGVSFFQRKEIKDIIAYFRLAVNPNDEEAIRRVINTPARGIGSVTLTKVFQKAHELNVSPWTVLENTDWLDINKGTQSKLDKFADFIRNQQKCVSTLDAYTLGLQIVRESGMQADIFHGSDAEDITRQENLQEFLDGMLSFVEERTESGEGTMLNHYLQEVSLLSDQDENSSEDDSKVTLMTVHAAKGLEFKVVFVAGMEELLFPNQMSIEHPRQIEEERRLFYVAITRAEQHLVLTYAKSRFRYGKTEFSEPSRFLKEIDSRYLRFDGGTPLVSPDGGRVPARFRSSGAFSSHASVSPSPGRLETPPSGFRKVFLDKPASRAAVPVSSSAVSSGTRVPGGIQVGTHIVHERFGQGVVKKIDGSGLDTKATVAFQNVGIKQLLLRFARFRVID